MRFKEDAFLLILDHRETVHAILAARLLRNHGAHLPEKFHFCKITDRLIKSSSSFILKNSRI